jgi:hypothetical protein
MEGRRLAVPRKLSDLMATPLGYLIDLIDASQKSTAASHRAAAHNDC